mmetsp:Transcript_17111/g.16333  ORF Transcript_17111/g.16333 Transcript_17111/m.16333 type:complete len:141 (+) Transcript_17111:348-770(+)
MVGFFIIQVHLTYNLPHMFQGDHLKRYWEQSLLQIQKSLEQVIMDSEYRAIYSVKREVVTFLLALRDLGLIQDLSFMNNLVKLHDVFIDKLVETLEYKVREALEREDYNQIEVKNPEDLFNSVDKYEIDLTKYIKMQNNI